MPSIMEAIDRRQFGTKGVREALDAMELYAIEGLLGEGRRVVRLSVPLYRFWHPDVEEAECDLGKDRGHCDRSHGRPDLADDRPSAMLLAGRCALATNRARGEPAAKPSGMSRARPLVGGRPGAIHTECAFCGFPLAMLLAVCEWAQHESRYVVVDLYVWSGPDGSDYVRGGPTTGTYQTEAWERWRVAPAAEKRARREAAAQMLLTSDGGDFE